MNQYLPTLVSVILAACGRSPEPGRTQTATAPPIAVAVVEARTIDWPVTYDAPGTVRAAIATTLASKVMGYVREVKVQTGDRVSAGQLLVRIDSRDLDSGLLQARAAEQEARSGIAEAENSAAAAKARLALAEVTFRRMEDLFVKTSISNQEFDEAQARLRTAEADYQMAVSKGAQLQARIAQAAQSVELASVMRSYGEIHAPFDGVVTEKPVEQGQLAAPGMPLVTIEQAGAYRLEAAVQESMLGRVRAGQNVSVLLDTWNQPLNARITEIVPAVDPASRTFLVKATLPAGPMLRSGLFGRLRVPLGTHQAIAIPADAILNRGALQSVFVAESGVARLRMVTTGGIHDGQNEILSGLHAGDIVIRSRPPNLADGVRVEVRK